MLLSIYIYAHSQCYVSIPLLSTTGDSSATSAPAQQRKKRKITPWDIPIFTSSDEGADIEYEEFLEEEEEEEREEENKEKESNKDSDWELESEEEEPVRHYKQKKKKSDKENEKSEKLEKNSGGGAYSFLEELEGV